MSDQIPTRWVKLKNSGTPGTKVLINVSDFDANVHEELGSTTTTTKPVAPRPVRNPAVTPPVVPPVNPPQE